MKRLTTVVCACAATILFGTMNGCSGPQHASRGQVDAVALGDLGPAGQRSDVFFLGAGDALGSAIFNDYVAVVRASSPEIDATYANAE